MKGISGPTAVILRTTRETTRGCRMSIRASAAAMGGLNTLYQWGAMGSWTDGQLIGRFLAGGEGTEDAFRILIHRHGPMVLGVCRRVLRDEHAAEDAFQLTFLIFVRKVGGLRDQSLLTGWLHGVALRVAKKERSKGARRQLIERQAAKDAIGPPGDPNEAELRSVIDEEIRRLPERYRLPLVLCQVEGLRHDEVAHRLGCPVGTIESRLSRARQQLRVRLTRRGLSPSASIMSGALRPLGLNAVAPTLVEATIRAAANASASPGPARLTILSAFLRLRRILVFSPKLHAGAISSLFILITGAALVGLAVYRAEGEPPAPEGAGYLPRRAAKRRICTRLRATRKLDRSRQPFPDRPISVHWTTRLRRHRRCGFRVRLHGP